MSCRWTTPRCTVWNARRESNPHKRFRRPLLVRRTAGVWYARAELNHHHRFRKPVLVRRAASVDSWSTRLELNQRKTVLQTAPLTVRARVHLGAGGGFEPPTAGLWGRRADHCSTLHVSRNLRCYHVGGPTPIRTEIRGFGDRDASHYTIDPCGTPRWSRTTCLQIRSLPLCPVSHGRVKRKPWLSDRSSACRDNHGWWNLFIRSCTTP